MKVISKSANGRPAYRGAEIRNLNKAITIIEQLDAEVERLKALIDVVHEDVKDGRATKKTKKIVKEEAIKNDKE